MIVLKKSFKLDQRISGYWNIIKIIHSDDREIFLNGAFDENQISIASVNSEKTCILNELIYDFNINGKIPCYLIHFLCVLLLMENIRSLYLKSEVIMHHFRFEIPVRMISHGTFHNLRKLTSS